VSGQDAITFGEKVLGLLDQGAFTATYKYSVLLALIDTCLEGADAEGQPPTTVHPHQLAARVIELYWPQARLYGTSGDDAVVLRQNSSGQAEIVTMIRRFKTGAGRSQELPLHRARLRDSAGYRKLVGEVAWKLVEMPLPRLQRFGGGEPFLYEIDWDLGVRRSAYSSSPQDFAVRLRPGVGAHLLRLAGLLRPLIQQQWAERVVQWNRKEVPELAIRADLDAFLFGASRADLAPVRRELRQLQQSRCLYCDAELHGQVHIDHFLPWARYPDDGIHNLVAAHSGCNGKKRDSLAAAPHVEAWSSRFRRPEIYARLERLADDRRWPAHAARTLSVARAVYLQLPGDALLWLAGDKFVSPDPAALSAALRASPAVSVAADDRAPFRIEGKA
jgi:5-methylcytosine-specific restriction endonuclease McrA